MTLAIYPNFNTTEGILHLNVRFLSKIIILTPHISLKVLQLASKMMRVTQLDQCQTV